MGPALHLGTLEEDCLSILDEMKNVSGEGRTWGASPRRRGPCQVEERQGFGAGVITTPPSRSLPPHLWGRYSRGWVGPS